MKLNKEINKDKIISYSKKYDFKGHENIFSPYIDFNFKINENSFYIALIQSMGSSFSCLEEFFPAVLYNSLEDAYKENDYEILISKIEPILLDNDSFIKKLQDIGLSIEISLQYVYLIYKAGLEAFYIGALTDGKYFSLAILKVDDSYTYHIVK